MDEESKNVLFFLGKCRVAGQRASFRLFFPAQDVCPPISISYFLSPLSFVGAQCRSSRGPFISSSSSSLRPIPAKGEFASWVGKEE